jgi:hypothetical protein
MDLSRDRLILELESLKIMAPDIGFLRRVIGLNVVTVSCVREAQ